MVQFAIVVRSSSALTSESASLFARQEITRSARIPEQANSTTTSCPSACKKTRVRQAEEMKTIGLVGGMGWESTALYYQAINRAAARTRRGELHEAGDLQLQLSEVNGAGAAD